MNMLIEIEKEIYILIPLHVYHKGKFSVKFTLQKILCIPSRLKCIWIELLGKLMYVNNITIISNRISATAKAYIISSMCLLCTITDKCNVIW